jgi:hypothetical protein
MALGRGGHIGPDATLPNALSSQASLKVVDDKLVAVNAGSDTASVFQIDFQNPAKISMIGQPVSTQGNFPVSATVNKANRNVCILNAGQVNGVSCYKTDLRLGLVPISNTVRSLNLNLTTPPADENNTPTQILFSDDGKQLFASVKGDGTTPGFLASWDVAADGSLSTDFIKTDPAAGGQNPASLNLIPGVDGVFNTDTIAGLNIFNFQDQAQNQTQTQNNATDVAVQASLIAIDGSKDTAWSDFSAKTGDFFVTDLGTVRFLLPFPFLHVYLLLGYGAGYTHRSQCRPYNPHCHCC